MRVAHQRDDGAWEFSDASPAELATFDLTGIVHPRRHSLSGRSTLSLTSTLRLGADKKAKLAAGELTTRGYMERDIDVDIEGNPPPAYCHVHRDSIVEP